MTTKKKFQITSGPDKFNLLDAFAGDNGLKRRTVKFGVRYIGEDEPSFTQMEVVVGSLARISGTKESWEFTGYVIALLTASGLRAAAPPIPNTCNGYFTTELRNGWIEF